MLRRAGVAVLIGSAAGVAGLAAAQLVTAGTVRADGRTWAGAAAGGAVSGLVVLAFDVMLSDRESAS